MAKYTIYYYQNMIGCLYRVCRLVFRYLTKMMKCYIDTIKLDTIRHVKYDNEISNILVFLELLVNEAKRAIVLN